MIGELQQRAARIIESMTTAGVTIAAAESVTGGGLLDLMTGVPGASAVVRGGVVAYSSSAKANVLHVDAELLKLRGPVCQEVAGQMARGVRNLLATTYAVATTGEAGPDSASGEPVGTVYVAVCGPSGTFCRLLPRIPGRRGDIRRAAVSGALALLEETWGRTGTRTPAGFPGNSSA